MPYLGIFGLEFEEISSYLKPAPRIFQIVKFREKTIMPKLRTENAFFGYFWAGT